MAGPHSEPSSIGMFVDDTIFVDELANKSPAELQAIGLNKLRTRCLISFTNTCFCLSSNSCLYCFEYCP